MVDVATHGIMTKKIPLTQGNSAIVDATDYHLVAPYKWRAQKDRNTYYAVAWKRLDGEKPEVIRLHRVIMGLSRGDGKIIDHINHDGLDNRRENLRVVTLSENALNRVRWRKKETATSKYFGVYEKRGYKYKKWGVKIVHEGRKYYLGYFHTETEAALAYNQAIVKLRGKNARLNVL